MRFVAQLVSLFLNPVVVLLPGLYLLVFRSTQNNIVALKWTFFSLVFSSVFSLFIFYGVKKGFFSDLDVSRREERPRLFLFTIVVVWVYLLSVVVLGGPRILMLAIADIFLGIVLVSLVNTRVKASGHVAVVSAFVTSFLILYGRNAWFILFLIPAVAWSRIILKKHTLLETIVGGILGICLVVGTYGMVKYVLIYLI